jgi:hypothetical protein
MMYVCMYVSSPEKKKQKSIINLTCTDNISIDLRNLMSIIFCSG